jgi:hypothetical protein
VLVKLILAKVLRKEYRYRQGSAARRILCVPRVAYGSELSLTAEFIVNLTPSPGAITVT